MKIQGHGHNRHSLFAMLCINASLYTHIQDPVGLSFVFILRISYLFSCMFSFLSALFSRCSLKNRSVRKTTNNKYENNSFASYPLHFELYIFSVCFFFSFLSLKCKFFGKWIAGTRSFSSLCWVNTSIELNIKSNKRPTVAFKMCD